jgi:molybdopterin synthase catalytic subunit
MKIVIRLTPEPIQPIPDHPDPTSGAVVCFAGVVRNQEGTTPISCLYYEIYQPMAESVIRNILQDLANQYPCHSVEVIHRFGHIPAGETSLWIRVRAQHRAEAFHLLTNFIEQLKTDVPIWKTKP